MPVQITINGADAAESIRELSTLAAAIVGQKVVPEAALPVQEEKPKRQRTTKAEAAAAKKQEEEPTEKPEVAEDAGSESGGDAEDAPTIVALRAAAQVKGKTPEGRKAVKALLDEFESKSISDVPEEKRAAFLVKLEEL
ncbi:hypothetical protein [Paenibacillus apiarius]|uniref:hypothetical protein n=1 Tax=Paenibacillus apiarius TaxID=46240 RepID=UPI003B3A0B12